MNLRIIGERTGEEVGWIRLTGASVSFANAYAQKLFEAYRSAGGWTDQQTFDALATGWSNGYVTIPAAT